jgi:uncharacterized protein
MSNIIDRRLNPRDKTIKNRQKFIQRSREQIKKAVKDAIDTGNIADIEDGKAKVKVKGISEPEFRNDPKSGDKKYVMPGNKDFVVGDTQDKPKDGDGQGGKEGGLGRGEDDFEFVLNQDEFLNFIFEDLELPDMVKKQMKDVTKVQMKRSGFTNVGNPSQLDVVRSLKHSLGRRIGLSRPKDEDIELLEKELEQAIADNDANTDINLAKGLGARVVELTSQLDELKRRQVAVPWLDPFDVRYRNFVPTPQPMTKAVMFCVMDISGSMGQREKDLAKRFFFFLHMFLKRKYEKVDIVFVMHHETAYEVNENDFFHSRESGGTVVSTALKLTKEIIDSRYNINDWNIYVAQASDGDNWAQDKEDCVSAMTSLLPIVQYFAYVEITSMYSVHNSTDLWNTYEHLSGEYDHLNMRKVKEIPDIWKVFKELFSKETT